MCKINFDRAANIKLGSRLTIGNSSLPETSLSISSIIVRENGNFILGKGVVLGGGVLLHVKRNAELCIGDNTYFTSDAHVESVNYISIGANCAISWGVTIIDDDHHKILYEGKAKKNIDNSVLIGNNVWIGCNVTILKNTVIGDNCVVSAGSIVKGEFPDGVLIGGNPARILKQNVSWI